ncbi:MAG: hypothetical protein HC924_11205 [Synechococcaceae cyanobacterium SM2_3_2]|nr:hypothetical protein [Synechococcaceae cyanobacterium SM2_3_2]
MLPCSGGVEGVAGRILPPDGGSEIRGSVHRAVGTPCAPQAPPEERGGGEDRVPGVAATKGSPFNRWNRDVNHRNNPGLQAFPGSGFVR